MDDQGMESVSTEERIEPEAGSASRIEIYVVAIFCSAFLIFLVQPMVGKRILPWFGGTPSVWALCLAFYQTTLFLGYAYAHLLIRFAAPRRQVIIHAVAAAAALLSLPVLPSDRSVALNVGSPIAAIFTLLTTNVALPFFLLASTGPLVQAWFTRVHPLRSPYPLYAVSNLGSLLALFAYPFVLEPRLTLSDTATLWTVGFVLTVAAVFGCTVSMVRSTAADGMDESLADESQRLRRSDVAFWVLLSGCAVVVLMGVTNKLCLDIASVPFLWILPLATYLFTFILCFSWEGAYRRWLFVIAALVCTALTLGLRQWSYTIDEDFHRSFASLGPQIGSYCALLFSVCMIMHGELYRLRPPARSLTAFYLCVSGGGALGGLFVGIVAPYIFASYLELHVGCALAAILLLCVWANERGATLLAGAAAWTFAVPAAATLSVLFYFGWQLGQSSPDLIHQERTFFGVLRVFKSGSEENRQRLLINGSTMHGVQFLDERVTRWPSSYYGRATGLGLALGERSVERSALRVGVVGLGIGTLAAYGQEDDLMRFYEIDPAVVRIARDDGFFSFLRDSDAEIEVVVGDARLALADEQARGVRQSFDFLILDAFSSDAIPVHLLTREAFQTYVAALAPDGLIAAHVSNRHFELMGLVAAVGADLGMRSLQIATKQEPHLQSQLTSWVFLGREQRRMDRLAELVVRRHLAFGLDRQAIRLIGANPMQLRHAPIWTDDFSDLFGLLVPSR